MKKFLLLAALAGVLLPALGCRGFQAWRPGWFVAKPTVMECAPACPAPCSPCCEGDGMFQEGMVFQGATIAAPAPQVQVLPGPAPTGR